MEIDWKLPIIIDACVLIDYCESDLSILSRFSQTVQPVFVGKGALDKVRQLSEAQARLNHIAVVFPDLELALDAAAMRGSLSYDDHETLLIAKSRGWCCLTNDKALRRECKKHRIQVRWGLEPMKILVARGTISPMQAGQIAYRISVTNPFITESIISEFTRQIRKIGRR